MRIRLDDFSLKANCAFEAGKVTALIGASGAGKSTFLSALAGFVDCDGGDIRWNGARIQGLPPARRPLATLFQDNNLFPHLTIAQNVGLALGPRLRPLSKDRGPIANALDRVGLAGFDARKPAQLSGGQQSRAALARVLLQDRPIVLLDEPFAALGPGLKRDMLALLRDVILSPERVVIMVTHDPEDARYIADDIAVVADGRVMPPAPVADVLDNPSDDIKLYLGLH
ncbi:thiamine ABC transporter ATP-binding protein [Marivivens niveibacter]|uniref:Thiamine ABC transporter ATP-binding protein n=1 Tax=Marivivens niveibacter TaxID=1930667 RepID=A0A251WZQ0_9RHOB|nr:thiamine ABC transporter ATP-binding protein [Marivivens niveibacter]